jgi:WD40 repeat protein
MTQNMQVTQSSEMGSTRLLHSSIAGSIQQQLWAVGCHDSKTRLYSFEGIETATLSCGAPVRKVRFSSSSSSVLATASTSLQLWDVRSPTTSSSSSSMTEFTLKTPAQSMEWHDTYLALTDRSRQLYVYDTRKGSSPIFQVPDRGAECVVWYQDYYLIMGDDRGMLHVWNAQQWHDPVWQLSAHSGGIYAMYAAKDQLVTGGADTTVLVWDAPTMTCLHSVTPHHHQQQQQQQQPPRRRTKYISSIAGSNGKVAVAGPDPGVDVLQGTQLVGTVPSQPVEEVAFHGPILACVSLEPGPVMLHKLSFGS